MAEQNTERAMPKYYPNDPCPCHSGRKYKHCCQKETARTRYLWEKFPATGPVSYTHLTLPTILSV